MKTSMDGLKFVSSWRASGIPGAKMSVRVSSYVQEGGAGGGG